MADGFGFGAEGDWKTAALVRAIQVMGAGLDGGTSFMQDYTYHLPDENMQVLGAHIKSAQASRTKNRRWKFIRSASAAKPPRPLGV